MTDLSDHLQASLGSAYRIEQELGGGGMSHVFVAEEVSLGRRVVIKVLPQDLANLVSIARFRREISLAARLQHPQIVPLLAAGDIDGLPYYTMPFVDGLSLRSRLKQSELTVAETISILRDVARGLDYAHAQGVTHRDIKPDNVLLAGTSAVITDFGVAKAINEARTDTALTSIGVALGTPAYMAPEQVVGDQNTDYRADIYAFGVMAYEMLAGQSPFAGKSSQAMIAAHIMDTPPPVTTLRPATPPMLADLIERCLEKQPADRPANAAEIIKTLDDISATGGTTSRTTVHQKASSPRRTTIITLAVVALAILGLAAIWRARTPASASGEIRSIAVLPFENTSRDTAFDYLEDGITDHVRDALYTVPSLTVKARGSSRQLAGKSAREIGDKLGVAAFLQGAVSGSRSRLHVTAELVRTSDDVQMWSGTFDGPLTEVAGLQDTISRAVAGILHLTAAQVGSVPGDRAKRGTADVEAYNLFLKGRHAADRMDLVRGADLLRAAAARDPRFARAHAYLAITYANMPVAGVSSVDSLNRLAQASVDRALALDSTIAEALVAESFIQLNRGHFAAGVKTLEKAVAIDSGNADIRAPLALNLAQIGRLSEGLAQARHAVDEDPLSSTALGVLSYMLHLSGQSDVAIKQTRATLEGEPNNPLGRRSLGFQYAFVGKADSAVRQFEAAFRLDSTAWGARGSLVLGYAAAGRWADAGRQRAIVARERGGNSPHWSPMLAALAYGEYDAAMAGLESGVGGNEPLFGIVS
ncbi:MAG: protein kinase, partial [Gemmatimonadaceae bacterium]